MANALIVFTPRSGSTIVGDLLAYKNNAINLDEIVTGSVRGPLREKLPTDVNKLLMSKGLAKRAAALQEEQNSSDVVKYWNNLFDYYKDGLGFIKEVAASYSVVLKYYPIVALPGVKLIEWAIDNNFELYFTYRENFEQQLYSMILADVKEKFYSNAKKAGKLVMHKHAGYLNIKDGKKVVFPPVQYTRPDAIHMAVKLSSIRVLWESYVKQYSKYGKLICYEETIAKNDFSVIGVTPEEFNQYQIQDKSLRPSFEYELGKQLTNWDEIAELASHFNIKDKR